MYVYLHTHRNGRAGSLKEYVDLFLKGRYTVAKISLVLGDNIITEYTVWKGIDLKYFTMFKSLVTSLPRDHTASEQA